MELAGLNVQNGGGIMDDAKAIHRSGHFHIPVRYGTFNQFPFRFPVFEKPAIGFQVSGERYARPKRAGLPPLLEEVANRKCFSFDREELDPAFYGSEALVPRLIDSFRVLTPIYHLLLEAVEAEQLQNV